MTLAAGQRIFTRSSISGDEFEYFVPATISDIDAHFFEIAPKQASDRESFPPLAVILAARGRVMLSVDLLEQSRQLQKLSNSWFSRRLDEISVCDLHAQANKKSKTPSAYRDSMVWVDGLRPTDAKLIPGPASTVLPLMRDYTAFVRRNNVDVATKLALAHYQILMIHPFFDGNGRLSRILALIHAQRTVGTARAFAIAAVLALHRRALRPLFDEVRNGNSENYLTYWGKLISWSADCVSRIADFRNRAAERLQASVAMFQSPERLVSFLLDNPLFSPSDLTKLLRSSDKLGARYIETLRTMGIIEVHPISNRAGYFRCPIALTYWRSAMENTASTSAALLPQ